MIITGKPGADTISQPAFFAHFGHQSRPKPTTTKDFIQQRRRKVIGIVKANTAMAKQDHRLRAGEILHFHPCLDHHLGFAGLDRARCRQFAQHAVQQGPKFSRSNIARCGHCYPVARHRCAKSRNNIIAGQGGDAGHRAIANSGIGMVAKGAGARKTTRNSTLIFFVIAQTRQDLTAHPVDRHLIKARRNQCLL